MAPTGDLTSLSLAQAGRLIRERSISPLELTEAYLDRIQRVNPIVNAYITVTPERALTDARQATDEIARAEYRGALHGVPIALKDLFDTAGIRTRGGAKVFEDRIPDQDGSAVRRLREAGTVLLGKLNTHELAFGGTTNNPHFGATRNPWNLDCIPGGSSGGSAAAIAAGLAAGTLGSDTAGSIRIPAAFCGVVGLKPTYGRVSKAGVLPLSWLFDHVGPITRTVEDAALMLQTIAGYDPDDFSTVRLPVDDYLTSLDSGVRGLRIGVPRAWFFERLDPEVRAAVEEALEAFRSLGARLGDVEIPGLEASLTGRRPIVVAELRYQHGPIFAERPQDFGADLQAALSGPSVDAPALVAGLRATQVLAEAVRRTLEEVDLLLMPTCPCPAPLIGQETVRYDDAEEPLLSSLIRLTSPFNATHLPALSLPCGFSTAGLPISLQIAGRPFDEATVLRAGQAYERATEWHLRRPPTLAALDPAE